MMDLLRWEERSPISRYPFYLWCSLFTNYTFPLPPFGSKHEKTQWKAGRIGKDGRSKKIILCYKHKYWVVFHILPNLSKSVHVYFLNPSFEPPFLLYVRGFRIIHPSKCKWRNLFLLTFISKKSQKNKKQSFWKSCIMYLFLEKKTKKKELFHLG